MVNFKFFKESKKRSDKLKFLNNIEWSEAFSDIGLELKLKGKTVGPTNLMPGDLALINYERFGYRKLLVVKTKNATNGKYVAPGTGNNLLYCYELVDYTPSLTLLFDTLYKNRIRCSYHDSPALLNLVFGKDKFRTFIISNISSCYEIYIEKQKD